MTKITVKSYLAWKERMEKQYGHIIYVNKGGK